MPLVSLCVAKELSEVIRVTEAVEAFLQQLKLSKDNKLAVLLSVEEALSNVIRHNQIEPASSQIFLQASASEGQIEIRIEDNGLAFDLLAHQPSQRIDAVLAQRTEGGLGIHLMRNLMDGIRYSRRTSWNCLIMVKKTSEGEREYARSVTA